METSLNIPAPAATVQAAPAVQRAITTKVQAMETTDDTATLPSNKPFVAQVVNARLSGASFPENPSEIVPPDRTLRPYDVPMLPYAAQDDANTEAQEAERGSRPQSLERP